MPGSLTPVVPMFPVISLQVKLKWVHNLFEGYVYKRIWN